MIKEARAVDTCALYGDAGNVAGHALTVDGATSFLGCDGRVAQPAGDVDVSIALTVATPGGEQEQSWVNRHTIDGVDVISASTWDAPNAPPRDQVVSWSCNYTARYPNDVRLMVQTSAPPEADACAVGEELMRIAISEFAQRPQWTSTKFATTVLTGSDPCAAAQRLRQAHRIQIDVQNSTVSTCAFTVDDGPMTTTSFGYQNPALLDVSAEQSDIDGHRMAGDPNLGVFDIVVGPEFQTGGETLVPLVTVTDEPLDMNRVRMVAQAVADEY